MRDAGTFSLQAMPQPFVTSKDSGSAGDDLKTSAPSCATLFRRSPLEKIGRRAAIRASLRTGQRRGTPAMPLGIPAVLPRGVVHEPVWHGDVRQAGFNAGTRRSSQPSKRAPPRSSYSRCASHERDSAFIIPNPWDTSRRRAQVSADAGIRAPWRSVVGRGLP